jgi:hypothetical protein
MKGTMKAFVGTWHIVEMDTWDQEYVNMEGPGHFTFKKGGLGNFHFGLVEGEMDCRIERHNGEDRIEFTWEGQVEMDSACGRGWAVIEEGELRGRIFFHLGDDSMFRAMKSIKVKRHE